MTPAEHHLGDRLAALVDGELGHDARERVLAHLATCAGCKAEADAQRQVKNAFAAAAPPPPSDGFLARLQGLPAADGLGPQGPDDLGPGSGPRGPGSSPADEGAVGAFSVAGLPGGADRSPWTFEYLPVSRGGRGPLAPQRGFRIHQTPRLDRPQRADRAAREQAERERAERERSASRGRRFAFAAAGAFSLAALAFGGTLAAGATGGPGGGGDTPSANSVRSAGSGSGPNSASRDTRRRGGDHRGGTLSTRSAPRPTFAPAPAASYGAVAPAPRLSASESLLQRSTTSPLSTLPALDPRRLSAAMDYTDWPQKSGPAGALRALSGSGKSVPKGAASPAASAGSRQAVAPDPAVLRSLPGRAPLATAPSTAPTAATASPVGH